MIDPTDIRSLIATPTDEQVQVMEGMWWNMVSTGWCVVELGYNADERKRTAEWEAEARIGLPKMSWNREYLRQWIVHTGTPVYLDWAEDLHMIAGVVNPVPGARLIRGWDLGPTARWKACVVGQVWKGIYFKVFREFMQEAVGSTEFIDHVKTTCETEYPGLLYSDFIDPAGFVEAETDARAVTDNMISLGILPQRGPVSSVARRKCVEDLLTDLRRGIPAYQVSEDGCPMLIQGFNGGYHLKAFEGVDGKNVVPVKNEFSHLHDANQYACHGFNQTSLQVLHADDDLGQEWQVLAGAYSV
jgi:hypothetical protein